MVFFPEHPKRDQNLKFTPLSEKTSIPPFQMGLPPPPPPQGYTVNLWAAGTLLKSIQELTKSDLHLKLWR